jgi:hypothetical protein
LNGNGWAMKLLTLMMVLVPAAAPAATIIDIVTNVTKVLPQVVGSPLDGYPDEIRLGSKRPRLIDRRQFGRGLTAGETALETHPSRYASKDGCAVTSQRGPDINAADCVISVTTSAAGGSVVQGTTLTIQWQTSDAPAGSAVALFPQKAVTEHVFDPIATALPTSGRHVWQIPIFVMQPIPCAPDITGGCVGSMNPGTTYRILARLYTPRDANLTEFGPGKIHPTWIAWTSSDAFTMLAAPAVPSR